MEREIDIAPRHLIDWIRADLARRGPRRLDVRATREFLSEDGPACTADLDSEDGIEVITTVGLLEVSPKAGGAHWVLRLRIEDGVGSHLPEDGSVPDGPEEIGLERFKACFLATDDPDATVTLEADTTADNRGFDRVFGRVLADSHAVRARSSA